MCIYFFKLFDLIFILFFLFKNILLNMGIGDGGFGVWGWGVGFRPQTPNPQSPIPNPQSPFYIIFY
jgi:hypothetical protein